MNSPSSASQSWSAPATPTMAREGDSSTPTETLPASPINIEKNSGGQVYNMEERDKSDRPTFDMRFHLANDSVHVKSLVWYLNKPTNADPNWLEEIESANAEAQDGTLFQSNKDGNTRNVSLSVNDAVKDHLDVLNEVMVIGIVWNFDKQKGETLSSAFAITTNNDTQIRKDVWDKINKSYYDKPMVKPIHSGGSGGHNGFTPPNNSSDNKNGSSSDGNGISTIGGNSSSSQTHNRGGGGLGTGAIAGIAVGVGMAALLAAALGIFFFLRRRRRGTPSTTALDHTHAAEQEKLSSFAKGGVAGGACASDAAIAPYRDDNSTLTNSHDRRRSSAATGAVAPGEDVARDQQPSPPKTAAAAAAAAAAAESRHSRTGNGVSRHLVEDGMTPEEIRRLEEEEAQLDDEIQRASGRRR